MWLTGQQHVICIHFTLVNLYLWLTGQQAELSPALHSQQCGRYTLGDIYVNMSTCLHLYKMDTLFVVIYAQYPFNMSTCHPVTIFTKWTRYCLWSLPCNSSICQHVDLSPTLHSRQYVRYTLRHIYVNLSTCHHLYQMDTLLVVVYG